jgi:hypothetical protein
MTARRGLTGRLARSSESEIRKGEAMTFAGARRERVGDGGFMSLSLGGKR